MSKINIHSILVLILTAIFLILLYISTNQTNTAITYELKNQTINLNQQTTYNFQIGEITIENKGFLPSKIKLKNLVLCEFPENEDPITYYTHYEGKTQYESNQPFYSGNSQYVEISSKNTIQIYIKNTIQIYIISEAIPSNYIIPNKLEPVIQTKNTTLYLFENNEEYSQYSTIACLNKNPKDAINTIKLSITN